MLNIFMIKFSIKISVIKSNHCDIHRKDRHLVFRFTNRIKDSFMNFVVATDIAVTVIRVRTTAIGH